jgi:hypothetical protein
MRAAIFGEPGRPLRVAEVPDTVDHGVEPLSEPTFHPEYEASIAWLHDADGTHIELMSILPAELLGDAHHTGQCSNQWVDGWQRNPAVTPRSGTGRVEVRR